MPRTLRLRKLIALDDQGNKLFARLIRNKVEGRREIMNSEMRYAITSVDYNNINWPIGEIYREWPVK